MHTDNRHTVLTTATRLLAILAFLVATAPEASAQTTYTWSNSNVTGATGSTFNWLNPTQGTWTGGTPVSSSLNTIKFFQDTTTALTNPTGPYTQISNIDNGGTAFQLGNLTLSGRGSGTASRNLTMTISGDPLNFSAATGTINLEALNNNSTITYNVNSAIQLGTGSSASALTITGTGTSAFNIGGVISELQAGGGSLIKSGSSTVNLTAANTYTGETTVNRGTLNLGGGTANGSLASTVLNLGAAHSATPARVVRPRPSTPPISMSVLLASQPSLEMSSSLAISAPAVWAER